jgi:XRE family transcriptional regulator, aerobic/anaerobic benzoate catabolism transcriptional regulator
MRASPPEQQQQEILDKELKLGHLRKQDASSAAQDLLSRLGQRVRTLRKQRELTIKELADATGLSVRFIAQLEAGEGNIAVSRLAAVASALGIGLVALLADVEAGGGRAERLRAEIDAMLAGRSEADLTRARAILQLGLGAEQRGAIALLGLRGAGKTSVGKRLAEIMELPFWELDERIEDLAGLSLAEIFALHGEAYYRRLEAQAIIDLLARSQPAVLALPGGVVNNLEAFALIKRRCFSIWLRAKPEEHMQRVVAQGDRRPIANRPNAMAELHAILSAREHLYQQADITIDTSVLTIERAARAALEALREQGWQ